MDIAEIQKIKNDLTTDLASGKAINEENTKNWYILPFFKALGYTNRDISAEVPVELNGNKRLDLYISAYDIPVMLVECKTVSVNLDNPRWIKQLSGYFYEKVSKDNVHFAVLTNGIQYRFFTDTVKPNIMDTEPYLVIDFSTMDAGEIITQVDRYNKDRITTLDNVKAVLQQRQEQERRSQELMSRMEQAGTVSVINTMLFVTGILLALVFAGLYMSEDCKTVPIAQLYKWCAIGFVVIGIASPILASRAVFKNGKPVQKDKKTMTSIGQVFISSIPEILKLISHFS